MLSSAPATLSGLIISFLLMVPEAASPSGPPSSRMSRTSAPVAITPERWGSTPRSRVNTCGETLLPSGGRGPCHSSSKWGQGKEAGREENGPNQVWVLSACVLRLPARLSLTVAPSSLPSPSPGSHTHLKTPAATHSSVYQALQTHG